MANKLLFISLGLLAVITPSFAQNYLDLCNSPNDCNRTLFLTCVDGYRLGQPGTCLCQDGTVRLNNECISQAGAPCSGLAPRQCVPNSECNNIICECKERYDPKPLKPTGELYCLGTEGENCTSTMFDCDNALARLSCLSPDPENPALRKCLCPEGLVWNAKRGKCLITPNSGIPCYNNELIREDNQCIDNAICNNFSGFCQCEGKEYDASHSQCRNSFGQNCTSTSECNEGKGLVCGSSTGRCECPESELYNYNITFPRCQKLAGGSCETDNDCGGGTTCHDDGSTSPWSCFCKLEDGKIQLPNRECGDMTGMRGGHCKSTANCGLGEYLNCTKVGDEEFGICECESDMEETSEGCRHLVGQACPFNHGCVKNAACINELCECLPGSSKTSDNHCLKTFTGIINSCNSDADCNHEEGLMCENTRCRCPGGQKWSSDSNHCVALVSGNCTKTNEHCTEHASCTDRGVCECNEGYSVHLRDPDDTFRICLPTYNQTCDPMSTPACNDQEFLTCNPDTSRCTCEYPLQQEWDSSANSCASLPGGYCGTLSELGGSREMKCLGFSTCDTDDAKMIGKCSCNAGYSVPAEENGGNQCRRASGALGSLSGLAVTSMLSFLALYAGMGKIMASV